MRRARGLRLSVVVFGSLNTDLVVRVPRFAAPGETLAGSGFFTAPGGKGANQAVASARLGAPTRMVGRVGADAFGERLIAGLRGDGVDAFGVAADPDRPSGTAVIEVDDAGQNRIVVVAGANGAVGAPDLARLQRALDGARVLLLQLEVPLAAVLAAARLGREAGATVVLDPAPARTLPDELWPLCDLVTPNETEAELLTGTTPRDAAGARLAARALLGRGARAAVVKLGARGAAWSDGAEVRFQSAFPVEAVDTVAAGDAFNGGVAAALDEGLGLAEAVRWGAAAGALSATRAGAQPSLPARAELRALLGV